MQVSNVEEVMLRRGDECTDGPWKRPDANAAAAGASATPGATDSDDPHEQESVLSILSGTRRFWRCSGERMCQASWARNIVVPNSMREMGCPEDVKHDEITMLQVPYLL
jgi:hypothetical protein